jgi:hypothetical protein
MRRIAPILIAILCASCAGIDVGSPEQRAARNRCEALRSYQPYRPSECASPTIYGVQ